MKAFLRLLTAALLTAGLSGCMRNMEPVDLSDSAIKARIETTLHIRNGEIPGLDRNIPIIALTAYAREKDRSRFLEIGMNEFVAKPFELPQLARALEWVTASGPVPLTPAGSSC